MIHSRLALLWFAAYALCSPIECPQTQCETLTNTCGESYGGCYDACLSPLTSFYTEPACSASSILSTVTASLEQNATVTTASVAEMLTNSPTVTASPDAAPSSTPSPEAPTITTNVAPQIKGPQWVTRTAEAPASTISPAAVLAEACVPGTLCVDLKNECGKRYGG
ncbi:hypothetical protein W97_06001 [Coniosporium apollinis CBS 100218]|uniref:Uncharacterized protein n=1 Tax=Coniosporium apollinis (strain CBS 100218) TaxID=1168221 RepID=R7YXT4_CONA1|nr:uncharacterized protein W97_06001 [Coniosporium apollinis CBS 100218]EON66755.1 hypothetical protein W97_06001 [Coniosporium apollinis CBS 100218]